MQVLTALFRPGSRGFTVGVLGAAAALALSGCSKKTTTTGSSSSPTSSPPPSAAAAAPTSTSTASASASVTVQTGQATVGTTQETVLTDAQGKTLYYRTSDTATTASCSGGCASVWPPLMASGSPTGGAGVTGKLTAVSSANGSQVQYNGHFLYRFASDTAAGSAKGEGVAGVWHVATPTLAVMAAAPAAPAPAATNPAPAASTPAPAASTPAPAASSSNPYGY